MPDPLIAIPTAFLPAERRSKEEVRQQAAVLDRSSVMKAIIDASPDILMVLNSDRQIVYGNRRLMEYLDLEDGDALTGQRPGEALGCLHAFETEGGCGTTEFCKTCGAARAVVGGWSGQHNVQECRILQEKTHGALDLLVHSSPLEVEGEKYAAVSLQDISHEKRRRVLERLFFHDLLNSAGGMRGLVELAKISEGAEQQDLLDTLYQLTDEILEEVQAQKLLVDLERDEYTAAVENLNSLELLQELRNVFRHHSASANRMIEIDERARNLNFTSDRKLLWRVMGNLIKNALEASKAGQEIKLGCENADGKLEFWVYNRGYIPRETQLQIFQRSFSTKGSGRGLGTYSVRMITEKYLKGRAFFTSTHEIGTTFYIHLPMRLEA
ncbi:MAG: HAMP domain-containing histidine kinase [Chloroflexi bacterium]|nr:HAMP domain-containing histidine kinase [Chloroflexota bacterium]